MDQIGRFFIETGTMLATIVRTSLRSLRENSGLAAVSVVLAFGLWIFVTDAENPTQTRVLPVDLPVQPVNVPLDVVVTGELATVRARISVEDHVFGSLDASDFEATVNLQGLAAAHYDELPVEVRPLTTRGGLRVEGVLPAGASVTLEVLVSKDVPVVLDVQGAPPPEYTLGERDAEDDTVRVSGAQARVDLVSQAYAGIDVTGRTEDLDQSVRLEPRDERGNLVEGVTLEPGITDVTVDITQVIFSKPVVVEPVIEGVPADGFQVVSVSSRPVTVVVSGDAALITQLQTIKTEAVDVGGQEEEVVQSVDLDLSGLPEGTTVIGSGSVTVTIGIERRPEESTRLPVGIVARN
jgi:YbbR domain-containing protein